MSETVHYKGTATFLASGEDVEPKARHLLLIRGIKEKPDYHYTWAEFIADKYYTEFFYHIGNRELYAINYKELDPNELIQASRNNNGSIDFHLLYYNGGAGFSECLEEAINKL